MHQVLGDRRDAGKAPLPGHTLLVRVAREGQKGQAGVGHGRGGVHAVEEVVAAAQQARSARSAALRSPWPADDLLLQRSRGRADGSAWFASPPS